MRPMLLAFVIVGFSASCALSQEKPAAPAPPAAESFAALNKEYQDALTAWSKERRAASDLAKKNGKEKDFKFDKPMPGALFSQRFLAIAEKNPEGPEAVDALMSTLRTGYRVESGPAVDARSRAVKILRDYHVTKPTIKGFLNFLEYFDEPECKAVAGEVIAGNPDRRVQAVAYKAQLATQESLARFAERVKDPKRLESIVKEEGIDKVKDRLVKAKKAATEVAQLKKTLREKYGEFYNELSIGNAAPEVKIQAIDGKTATLSALKGKVVVLDIWATWCGPCRGMIPHEREMVERLKDKPFVLVSISADDEKKTLTDFLAKEKMPWTHWWNGKDGGIIEDWDVRYYPTIYVLDTKGVIRHKDLRGAELEKAVNTLLAEKPQA
jgi:thiol-disulfide isomerase/thioredoxin